MKKLSPKSQRIIILIDLLTNGSQRKFAREVGCSHSVIAKIANGQQEAGKEILGKIIRIPSINGKWLETGKGEPLLFLPSEAKYLIPIANSLLPRPPSENKGLHTTKYLALQESIFQPTRYAIEAINCFPRELMPTSILPQDLLIIETADSLWKSNLQALIQKYAVIVTDSAAGKLLELKLLQVKRQDDSPPLLYCIRNESFQQSSKYKNEKLQRRIDIENVSSHQETQSHDQDQAENSRSEDLLIPIDVKQIAGTVIQLIRNY